MNTAIYFESLEDTISVPIYLELLEDTGSVPVHVKSLREDTGSVPIYLESLEDTEDVPVHLESLHMAGTLYNKMLIVVICGHYWLLIICVSVVYVAIYVLEIFPHFIY